MMIHTVHDGTYDTFTTSRFLPAFPVKKLPLNSEKVMWWSSYENMIIIIWWCIWYITLHHMNTYDTLHYITIHESIRYICKFLFCCCCCGVINTVTKPLYGEFLRRNSKQLEYSPTTTTHKYVVHKVKHIMFETLTNILYVHIICAHIYICAHCAQGSNLMFFLIDWKVVIYGLTYRFPQNSF